LAIQLNHYFTEVDLKRYDKRPELYGATHKPKDQLRYYIADYSETRFFRHRKRLKWEPTDAWPTHLGRVCPERILVHHFKYRSPSQMQVRFQTRSSEIAPHWTRKDWRSVVRDSSELHYDEANGDFVIDYSKLPDHRDNVMVALAKVFMHGIGIWP
jgi:hypothetical protein